jgi:hypothetical protein
MEEQTGARPGAARARERGQQPSHKIVEAGQHDRAMRLAAPRAVAADLQGVANAHRHAEAR